MRGAVDDHRPGKCRQRRGKGYAERPAAGDVELDDVGAGRGIGIEDGLAQGTRAAVVYIYHGERRLRADGSFRVGWHGGFCQEQQRQGRLEKTGPPAP